MRLKALALFADMVPMRNFLFAGTVPVNSNLLCENPWQNTGQCQNPLAVSVSNVLAEQMLDRWSGIVQARKSDPVGFLPGTLGLISIWETWEE